MHDTHALFKKKPTQSMNAGTRAVYSMYNSDSFHNMLEKFSQAKTSLEQIKNKYTELLLEKNGGVKLDRATQAKLNAVMKNDLLILSTMEECAQWALSGATAKDLANISKKLTALQKKNMVGLSIVELVNSCFNESSGVNDVAGDVAPYGRAIVDAWNQNKGTLQGAQDALVACNNYLSKANGNIKVLEAGIAQCIGAMQSSVVRQGRLVTLDQARKCSDALNQYIMAVSATNAAQGKLNSVAEIEQELRSLVGQFQECINGVNIMKQRADGTGQQDVESLRTFIYKLQRSLSGGHHADAEFNPDGSVRRDGPSARYMAFGAASQDDNFVGDMVDAPSREVVSSWKPYGTERVADIRAQKEMGAAQVSLSGHHADAEFNSVAGVRRDGTSARYRALGAASRDDNFVGDMVGAPSREVVNSWKPYGTERVADIRDQKEMGAAQSPVSDMKSVGEETAAPAAGKKRLGDRLKGLLSKKSKK